MKYGRFTQHGRTFFGVIEGAEVTELEGSLFDSPVRTGVRHSLYELKLLPPCVPSSFYCAGINYAAHIDWVNRKTGLSRKVPTKADIGYRSPSALIAGDEAIVIPADSLGPVQFEGEFVAVIGKTARNLSESDALSCVLGYTLGNDVSERTWQEHDRTQWRSKNCDTFKPFGPVIVTGLDPMNQIVTVRLNGQTVSEYSTSKMLFSLQHYIARITQYITLHPGDVIWLGTDGPTEPDLKDGDVVEICNEHIGVLRNPVQRASA
jgi:2-keto-4-pentenoate hydratase/2-oxohepta-3-ene-1,7-dioic acid hydratase in catechol pathway